MKPKWKTLIICLIIPLAIGALSGILSSTAMDSFKLLTKPPLSPPGWLFPVVWTVLFILMGVASYLVLTSDAQQQKIESSLLVYALQLGVNFFWSIIFFNLELYLFAFIWLLLLWTLIIITIKKFYRVSPVAAALLIPYVLWVTFAGYLNLAIYILN